VNERHLPDNSFYAIVNQIPDDGQKTGRKWLVNKTELQLFLEVVLIRTYN